MAAVNGRSRSSIPSGAATSCARATSTAATAPADVFYIDWPSWAGAARDQSGPAANILTLTSDKEEYQVGDTAVIQLPEAAQGRALLTLENGSAILEQRWIEAHRKENRVSIPITAAMAPNVYVAVTLVQPHAGKDNDRPIRLYGVIPLKVTDPADQAVPGGDRRPTNGRRSRRPPCRSARATGRAMNYTLAVVDEGLLGLTNFRTPEPARRSSTSARRSASPPGICSTKWPAPMAANSIGCWRSAAATPAAAAESGRGQVALSAGGAIPRALRAQGRREAKRTVELPQYVGAVRVMVVAGRRPVPTARRRSRCIVRQPLMILPTLPRVVGPGEQITVPVSVFASEASDRDVTR